MDMFFSEKKYPLFLLAIFFVFIIATVYPLTTAYPQLCFLPILAIIFFISAFKFPSILFYSVIFLVPFGAYRQMSSFGGIKIHWLLSLGLLLVAFIKILLSKNIPTKIRGNIWPWLFIFFIWNFISALYSPFPATAFSELKLIFIAILFIALGIFFIDEKGYVNTLPKVIVASISISSLLGGLGFFFNVSLFAVDVTSFKRSLGGTTDPNVLAITVLFGLVFIAHFFFRSQNFFTKLLAFILGGINLLAMVTAYSRSGAIAVALLSIVLGIVYRKYFSPRLLGFIGLGIIMSFFVAWMIIPASYWDRQISITDTSETSMSRRGSYLEVGFEAIKLSPLKGLGPGCFQEIFALSHQAKRYAKKPEDLYRFAHNTYIEVLVGSGSIGIILFIGLLAQVYRNFFRAFKYFKNQEMKDITTTYIIALSFVMLYLLVLSDLQQKYMLLSIALSQVAYFYSEIPKRVK